MGDTAAPSHYSPFYLTLDQLRVFVTVADTLHVTKAASLLKLTQSAASASIANLESRSDVKLFNRVGRNIELTEAGKNFLPHARSLLNHAAQAALALDELTGLKRGRLSVYASQTIANYWLPPIVTQFRHSYPGIAVDVTIGNTETVEQAVDNGSGDIGFVEGVVRSSTLLRAEILGDRLTVVVPVDHLLAKKEKIEIYDFLQTEWVLREKGSGTRDLFERRFEEIGGDSSELAVVLELPSNEAVRAAVIAGAGATALSELVVEQDLRLGSLVRVPLKFPNRKFTALRHPERYQSKACIALMNLVGPSSKKIN